MPAARVPHLRQRAARATPSTGAIQRTDGGSAPREFAAKSTTGPDSKTSAFPSGEKDGREPNVVSWRGTPPSAGTSQTPPTLLAW